MLDMGFIPTSARSSPCCPRRRQNLLFSATFSDEIRTLAERVLNDPATVEVAPAQHDRSRRSAQIVYPVDRERKRELLAHLIRRDDLRQVLVFTRTKIMARAGSPTGSTATASRRSAIHGDRTQPERDAGARGVQERRAAACSSRPTSRRAASTSRTCRTSSTSSCRRRRRTTSTGSAAPAGPARPARPISLVCVDEAEYLRGHPAAAAQGDPLAGRGGFRAPPRPGGSARAGARAARRERRQWQPRWPSLR